MRHCLLALALLFGSASLAHTQTFVSASVEMDVFRHDHARVSGFEYPSGGGEVIGGSLRVGSAIGERWGVELEFVRSGRVETQSPLGPILRTGFPEESFVISIPPQVPPPDRLAAPIQYRSEMRRRHTSLNAAIRAEQSVSGRVDLVYLGGIGFLRRSQETSFGISPVAALIPIPVRTTKAIDYGVGALAGFEAQISLSEHLHLVPGLRLQSLPDGWWLRTTAGLGWTF